MRKTWRPCWSASRACMRAPLRYAASMTTVASAYPLITALRIGNDVFVGGEPGRN